MKTLFVKKIEIRAFFSELHRKLGADYKKIHIERVSEDVCLVKRYPRNFEKSYVLIVRASFDPKAPPADFSIQLPGGFQKVKKLIYFEREFDIIEDDFSRVKARIVEQNELGCFGSVSQRLSNKHRFLQRRTPFETSSIFVCFVVESAFWKACC